MWFTVNQIGNQFQVVDAEFNKLIATFENQYLAEDYARYRNDKAKASRRPCFN